MGLELEMGLSNIFFFHSDLDCEFSFNTSTVSSFVDMNPSPFGRKKKKGEVNSKSPITQM